MKDKVGLSYQFLSFQVTRLLEFGIPLVELNRRHSNFQAKQFSISTHQFQFEPDSIALISSIVASLQARFNSGLSKYLNIVNFTKIFQNFPKNPLLNRAFYQKDDCQNAKSMQEFLCLGAAFHFFRCYHDD